MLTRYLDPLEVHRVHDGALEEGDGGEVSLDQPLQLQARRGPGQPESAQLASVLGVRSTFMFYSF